MVLAIWNVFMLPISIAFKINNEAIDIVNNVVDVTFLIDILIMFRTTIVDDNLNEIRDPEIISRKYLRGKFTIDFLSTIPFDLFAGFFMPQEQAREF